MKRELPSNWISEFILSPCTQEGLQSPVKSFLSEQTGCLKDPVLKVLYCSDVSSYPSQIFSLLNSVLTKGRTHPSPASVALTTQIQLTTQNWDQSSGYFFLCLEKVYVNRSGEDTLEILISQCPCLPKCVFGRYAVDMGCHSVPCFPELWRGSGRGLTSW